MSPLLEAKKSLIIHRSTYGNNIFVRETLLSLMQGSMSLFIIYIVKSPMSSLCYIYASSRVVSQWILTIPFKPVLPVLF